MKPTPSPEFEPLRGWREIPVHEMLQRAVEFREEFQRRRTVREFSGRPVPRGVIEECLRAAGTAPSGANLQPWHFVAVSDLERKRRIRLAAEEEEREFYRGRAPKEWLETLAPLGTDARKPFLEIAPWLLVVFVQRYGLLPDGRQVKHYYPTESVGLSVGLLIAALHRSGLATLTHTPSPMNFLNELCGRPVNERPFLILVAGYPADGARVPRIGKKRLEEFTTFLTGGEVNGRTEAAGHPDQAQPSPGGGQSTPSAGEPSPADAGLHLRPLGPDDGDELVAFLSGNVWPFHGVPRPAPEAIRKQISQGRFRGDAVLTWWIEVPGDGRIGLVRLFDLDDATPLFDLRIGSAHRGRGRGSAALRALTSACFESRPEKVRLAGYTRSDNLAMRRAMRSAGYLQEAGHRLAWEADDGSLHDCVAYAILREEWERDRRGSAGAVRP